MRVGIICFLLQEYLIPVDTSFHITFLEQEREEEKEEEKKEAYLAERGAPTLYEPSLFPLLFSI